MIMKNDYFFLSNFYPGTVIIDIEGRMLTYQNSEAAFQAQKNYELADKFCLLKALEAKKYGKAIPLTTPNWDQYRLVAMAKCLNSKFLINHDLLEKLKKVDEPIVEDNYWGDQFWGVCKGKGKNMLGKMLTNIKENDNNFSKLIEYINNELIKEC